MFERGEAPVDIGNPRLEPKPEPKPDGGITVSMYINAEGECCQEVNGTVIKFHPYVWWQLEQQAKEGWQYWLRGRDVFKSHSVLLDKTGHDRKALERVKQRANEDYKKSLTVV